MSNGRFKQHAGATEGKPMNSMAEKALVSLGSAVEHDYCEACKANGDGAEDMTQTRNGSREHVQAISGWKVAQILIGLLQGILVVLTTWFLATLFALNGDVREIRGNRFTATDAHEMDRRMREHVDELEIRVRELENELAGHRAWDQAPGSGGSQK